MVVPQTPQVFFSAPTKGKDASEGIAKDPVHGGFGHEVGEAIGIEEASCGSHEVIMTRIAKAEKTKTA